MMKQTKILLTCLFFLAICNIIIAQDFTGTKGMVQLMESNSFYYCTLEMTGSYEQHPEAFTRLMNFCSANNIEMMPAGIYWNSPSNTEPEDLKWELAVFIPNDMKVDEPLKVKKWDYSQCASVDFDGVFLSADESKVISEIYKWISDNGYSPVGPMVRKFLNQPMQTPDGQWAGKAQIIVPVEKK